jgi:hypothetical protein
MSQQGKYQRAILTLGFVQVTEINDHKSFFPQITFYDREGRHLVTVDTEDSTASKFLHALKKLAVDTYGQSAEFVCPINGGMVYHNLYYKDGELMLVKRDDVVGRDNALIIISKEDAIGLIASIVALH